jgi:hypothetical protein
MFNLLSDVDRNNVSNLVNQLATLNEFWLIMRLLDAVDYGAPATAATTIDMVELRLEPLEPAPRRGRRAF